MTGDPLALWPWLLVIAVLVVGLIVCGTGGEKTPDTLLTGQDVRAATTGGSGAVLYATEADDARRLATEAMDRAMQEETA